MPDPKPTPLFSPAAPAVSPVSPVPTAPVKPLSFDGVASLKSGTTYFGQFKEDDNGVVTVTVPTAGGDVRTVRHLKRSDIASQRTLDRATILRLAKIGPHVLFKADVERIAPAALPTPGQDDTAQADPASPAEAPPVS